MVPYGWRSRCKVYPLVILVLVAFAINSGTVAAFHARVPHYTGIIARTKGSLSASSNGGSVEDTEEDYWRQALPSPLPLYRRQCLQRVESWFPVTGESLEVFVIGTAHVSTNSSRDVRLLLETICPDIVFLEMCEARFNALRMEQAFNAAKKEQKEKESPAFKQPKKQRLGFLRRLGKGRNNKNQDNTINDYTHRLERFSLRKLSKWIQKEADSLGTTYGGEMLAAYEYWKGTVKEQEEEQETNPVRLPMLVLGDRPIDLTTARILETMTKWDKTKMLLALSVANPLLLALGFSAGAAFMLVLMVESGFGMTAIGVVAWAIILLQDSDEKEMKEDTKSMDTAKTRKSQDTKDTEETLHSLIYKKSIGDDDNDFFDGLLDDLPDALLRERDVYMACKLFQACKYLPTQNLMGDDNNERKRFSAVAIVGAGHVDGMCSFFSELLSAQNPEEHLPPLLQSKRLQLGEAAINELVLSTSTISHKAARAPTQP